MYDELKYIDKGIMTVPYIKKLDGEEIYEQAKYFLKEAKHIVFLTGAGISTNANIPDFRSKQGWYSKSPEDILSRDNFFKNPREVCDFLYKYYNLIDVDPTLSHNIIADLENKGKNVTVITQNVDMLHKKSKSSNVFEFHGSFNKAHCYRCKKDYPITDILNENVSNKDFSVKCECRGYIKPDIVLFGEDIKYREESMAAVRKADLLIIVGTSLSVQPFASLPSYAPMGTPYIIINNSPTYLDDNRMSVVLNGDCDEILSKITKGL